MGGGWRESACDLFKAGKTGKGNTEDAEVGLAKPPKILTISLTFGIEPSPGWRCLILDIRLTGPNPRRDGRNGIRSHQPHQPAGLSSRMANRGNVQLIRNLHHTGRRIGGAGRGPVGWTAGDQDSPSIAISY